MESFAFSGLGAIQSETLSVLLIIAACSSAYCFIVGEITRNNRESRHPNYLAEQSIWVSFYLFSIVAGAGVLNWSICGAVLLILLFLGSSTLGEYISRSKYPEYAEYVKKVNRFFPGKAYRSEL